MWGGDKVELCAITPADVPAVADFLHRELNDRVSPTAWAQAMTPPWSTDWPDHGMFLRHDGEVVGVQLAFYSTRELGGNRELFCNLGAWCVREEHRGSGLRLLRGLLGRKEYTFTDLSPSGNVVGLNRRLKFVDLDTTTSAVPAVPGRPGSVRVTSDPAEVAREVPDGSRRVYEDHRTCAGAHHVVISDGDRRCYLVFRRDRRKRLPLFATVLHVSDPELFARAAPAVARHVLVRHRVPVLLVEERVAGGRPRGSLRLGGSRARMFRSDHLGAEDVDYLYSELTCVAW